MISNSLKRLLIYSIPFKKIIFIASMISWCASIAEIFCPILISYFIDHVLNKNEFSSIEIATLAFSFFLLQIISAILHFYQVILFNKAAIGIVQKIRIDSMNSAIRQPLSVFDSYPVGKITSKVTNDAEVVKDLFISVIPNIVHSLFLIISMLISMFFLEWHMAVISSLIFPLVFFVMIVYQRCSVPIIRKVRVYLADINNTFHEIINGAIVVQQFQQYMRFGEKLLKINQEHYIARMKVLKLDSFLLRPLLNLFFSLILCGLILLFGLKGIAGGTSVGILYVFINYLGRLNEPLIKLTAQQSILQQALISGERIFELIDKPIQCYGKDKIPLLSGSINIQDLSFSYKNNSRNVLQNINLRIQDNEFVALVGDTGSGKSTISSLLVGNYKYDHGKIFIDNRLFSSFSRDVLRNCILIVQQDPVILSSSFFENIALGRSVSRKRIWKILKIVQLADLVKQMPDSLETLLGEQGRILSAGQKQLLSIARVLVKIPEILIFDEATSNLDYKTEQAIQNILKFLRNKTTLIIIAHRLSTIVNANKIFVLNKGKIVEYGTHNQLLKKHGYYFHMYKLQEIKSSIKKLK